MSFMIDPVKARKARNLVVTSTGRIVRLTRVGSLSNMANRYSHVAKPNPNIDPNRKANPVDFSGKGIFLFQYEHGE